MAEPVILPPDVSMAMAHDGFRFALASAPALIKSAKGDNVRRGLIADFYANVLVGLEVHHDGEEELLFPLLIERFPEERDKIDLGAEQHHEVVSLMAAATEAVSMWESEDDTGSRRLLSTLAALEQALSVHLDYEQTTIVPLEGRLAPKELAHHFSRTADHHMAKLPPNFLFALYHGEPLLWQAVGEASFREMIANVVEAS